MKRLLRLIGFHVHEWSNWQQVRKSSYLQQRKCATCGKYRRESM